MKVEIDMGLTARVVALMHKNCPEVFSKYIYTFMEYYGCSRTEEELLAISTDELLKDMWRLKITMDSFMCFTSIDDNLLHRLLHEIKCRCVEDIRLSDLLHEFAEAMINSGDWEDV